MTDLDDLTRLSVDPSGGGSGGDGASAEDNARRGPSRTKRALIVALVLLLVPIAAVTGYAPSREAADALIGARLAAPLGIGSA